MPANNQHFSDCILADSPELLETAFRLRHAAYTAAGYIHPEPSGMVSDQFDAAPVARTLLFRKDGRALGTVRLLPDSQAGLWASDQGFGAEIAQLRSSGRRLLEAGKLAFPAQSSPRRAVRELVEQLIRSSLELGADDIIITVQPKCVALYERRLGFQRVSDRAVTYATYPPVVLMRLDVRAIANQSVGERQTA